MAKKTYKDPHTQIRNDVLVNLCRAKLKRTDYYRFLMILFRETFGRKNMKGTARGKFMNWEPSIWIDHGMTKYVVAKVKKELLSLRVIRRQKGQVGFNWHYHQWKVEWHVAPADNSYTSVQQKSCTSVQQKLHEHTTEVVPADNKTGDSPADSTDAQSIKKERKKEKEKELEKDGAKAPHGVSLKEEKSDPIFDGFATLWNKYFKNRAKTTENFKSALHEYRKLVDGEKVTVDEVYDALARFKLVQERHRIDYEYYPMLKNWIKREEWVGHVPSQVGQYWIDKLDDKRLLSEERSIIESKVAECKYKHALKLKEKQNEQT
jgi:hypothetical protein